MSKKERFDDAQFEVIDDDQGFTVEEAYALLAEVPLPPVEVEPVE